MGRHRFALVILVLASFPCWTLLRAQNQSGMVPFSMDHRRALLRASPVDVSSLLDALAGKHGFVRIEEGHLATADGRRIRFWGVNITDWSKGSRQIPSKDNVPFWAATLARFGVNSVRFQFLDLEAPRGLIKSRTSNVTTWYEITVVHTLVI